VTKKIRKIEMEEKEGAIDHHLQGYCCVCTVDGVSVEGESFDDTVTVFCGKCNIAVHSACYGNPLVNGIPEGDWICERCQWNASDSFCVLCPVKFGAMKRTTDFKWAHLSCALWIPEVFFRYAEGREPIDYFQLYPLTKRWNRVCYHCGKTDGICLECSEPKCNKTFHVTCGMKNKIYLEYKQNNKGADVVVSYCTKHAKYWRSKRAKRSVIVAASSSKQQDDGVNLAAATRDASDSPSRKPSHARSPLSTKKKQRTNVS